MLTCDFNLCIYQSEGFCTLDAVDINSMEICDSAVVIDPSEENLVQYKKELLEKLAFYYGE